ncbi:CD209 antigen-like protein C [Aquarana catesbeiana]|uniref:CD209 antigen-like protein C n=1 Tax=Aquarana catesbeiana TaxID=8400 RepID=UPI003CC9AE89
MVGPENLEMEPGQSHVDGGYVNVNNLNVRRLKKTEKAKEVSVARSRKYRVILTLEVLQILAFITLAILIRLLFIYYKNIKEDISQLKSNRYNPCCPADWIPIGSKCYYFQETMDTWERSQEGCAKNYSVFLTLKNKDELEFLQPFIVGDRYWIGLRRDTQNSDRWLWVDGTPLTFSLWEKGEPNNLGGHENCIELRKNIWLLNDYPCDDKKRSICEALSRC